MKEALKTLVQKYVDAFNNNNINLMLSLIDDNVKFESISNSTGSTAINGRLQLAQVVQQSLGYFEERTQTINSWTIDKNRVAIEVTIHCKLAKSIPGGAEAGEKLVLNGASFFTIKKGKILKMVEYL